MRKRVFIVHGWYGNPEEGWFPWLKRELGNKGFGVEVPAMPDPAEPKVEAWVPHLFKVVGDVDQNTFFVGHSVGCQTIIRYLESLPAGERVGGAVFVAGWFKLVNLETEEEKEIVKPWLETPIDFEKVRQHTDKLVAIFSDNDQGVPIDNKDVFERSLGAKIVIEKQKGHFSGDDGVNELPIALDSVLSISQ